MRFLYNVIVSQLIYAAIFFKNAVFSLFLSWGKGAGLKIITQQQSYSDFSLL